MDIKQAYRILNVHEGASAKTIKSAYKKLVLKYHPDNHNTGNAEKFEAIVKAYYVVRYLSKGEISQAEFADTLHELRAKIISGERSVDHLEWWQKRNREIEEAQKEKKAKRIMGWWNAYGSKSKNVDGVKERIEEKPTSSTENDIGAEYDRAGYGRAEYNRAESDSGTEYSRAKEGRMNENKNEWQNTSRSYGAVHAQYEPRKSKSRRSAALVAVFAILFLGVVWWIGLDPADVGGIALDGIGDLAEYGSAALSSISDMADSGGVALDDLADTTQETVDAVEIDAPDTLTTDEYTADLQKSLLERADEDMTETPTDTTTVDIVEVPKSPLDRTIYPDGTTHGSRSDTSGSTTITTPNIEPKKTKTELIEDLVYDITNQHREAAGLQPLMRISKIDQIARSHSEDMAKRGYFAHDTPEGLDPTDRGNAAGYPCRKDYGSYYTYGLAENIFEHGGYWYGAERLANEIMDGWMNSPGHRQNIMHTDYDRIGVGVIASAGAVYATQNFC